MGENPIAGMAPRGAPPPIATRPQPGAQALSLARAGANTPEEVRRAASEFESVFLSEMLAPMFEGLSTDGLGGGGVGEQIFRPMLIQNYAAAIAKAGGVGVAESLTRELLRLQEQQGGPPQTRETPDGPGRGE